MRARFLPHPVAAVSAAVAVSLLAVACSPPHPRAAPARHSPAAPPRHSPAAQPVPIPAPTVGLLPAPSGLTDRLVLQRTSVPAGTPIKGALVVSNSNYRSLDLTRGCAPDYIVVLIGRHYTPQVAFPADCAARRLVFKPGETRLPITVLTTYLSCSQAKGAATGKLPSCLEDGTIVPPLPAGSYEAVLEGAGLPLPPPAPVPVRLSPAPAQ